MNTPMSLSFLIVCLIIFSCRLNNLLSFRYIIFVSKTRLNMFVFCGLYFVKLEFAYLVCSIPVVHVTLR